MDYYSCPQIIEASDDDEALGAESLKSKLEQASMKMSREDMLVSVRNGGSKAMGLASGPSRDSLQSGGDSKSLDGVSRGKEVAKT